MAQFTAAFFLFLFPGRHPVARSPRTSRRPLPTSTTPTLPSLLNLLVGAWLTTGCGGFPVLAGNVRFANALLLSLSLPPPPPPPLSSPLPGCSRKCAAGHVPQERGGGPSQRMYWSWAQHALTEGRSAGALRPAPFGRRRRAHPSFSPLAFHPLPGLGLLSPEPVVSFYGARATDTETSATCFVCRMAVKTHPRETVPSSFTARTAAWPLASGALSSTVTCAAACLPCFCASAPSIIFALTSPSLPSDAIPSLVFSNPPLTFHLPPSQPKHSPASSAIRNRSSKQAFSKQRLLASERSRGKVRARA